MWYYNVGVEAINKNALLQTLKGKQKIMTLLGKCLLTYLLIVNLLAFILCGLDKWKAKRGYWRVPERILFGMSFLGGGAAFWLGMELFRHKTRHLSFRILIPLSVVLWIGIIIWLLMKGVLTV